MAFFSEHWRELEPWEQECFLTMAREYSAFRRQVYLRLHPASVEPRLASPRSGLHPSIIEEALRVQE